MFWRMILKSVRCSPTRGVTLSMWRFLGKLVKRESLSPMQRGFMFNNEGKLLYDEDV